MTMMNILTTSTTLISTKTVISEKIIRSVMVSITAIQIPTTSTTTVKTITMSKKLIQRTILIMYSYVIIANAAKFLIPFKNMVDLLCIIFNLFNNLKQIYS